MAEDNKMIARIVKAVGGQYQLDATNGFRGIAAARGIFRLDGITPTPGDLVVYESSGDPDVPWVISEILPRRNYIIRPALANLDRLLITAAATEPAPDFFLIDKLITVCLVNNIEPILIITKNDQATAEPQIFCEVYDRTNLKIIFTSIDDKKSHIEIRGLLPEQVVSFAGQSGVGKSTLLNQLFGDEMMETGGISDKIGRGRHTTRHVELFSYAGGYLADTPGFSTLELIDLGITSETIEQGYPEIAAVSDQCRFSGCRHLGDLGCAVTEQLIHPDRLERYRMFRRQLDQIKPYESSSQQTNSRTRRYDKKKRR
jgi:ribosome biogenesis GTPase